MADVEASRSEPARPHAYDAYQPPAAPVVGPRAPGARWLAVLWFAIAGLRPLAQAYMLLTNTLELPRESDFVLSSVSQDVLIAGGYFATAILAARAHRWGFNLGALLLAHHVLSDFPFVIAGLLVGTVNALSAVLGAGALWLIRPSAQS